MNPKLSVIIPVYRVEKFLRQCLDSVVNQTFRDMEIFLIDDGSPDSCGKICDEYAVKDDRITVIHKQNEGLCAARNEGIVRAAGEWITFVDSDDWLEVTFYEQMFNALGTQQVDIFCSGGIFRAYVGKTEESRAFNEPFLFTDSEHLESLRGKVICALCCEIGNKTTLGAVWNKLYRREFLIQNRLLFDISFKAGEDVWYNFQVLDKAGAVGACPVIGYHYRMVATSIMNGFNAKKAEYNYHFVKHLYSSVEGRASDDRLVRAVEVQSLICFTHTLGCSHFHPSNPARYKEMARQVRGMKTWPYYQRMIHSKGNPYFSKKQLVFKTLLRMPWIWPLKAAYLAKQLLSGQNRKKNYY